MFLKGPPGGPGSSSVWARAQTCTALATAATSLLMSSPELLAPTTMTTCVGSGTGLCWQCHSFPRSQRSPNDLRRLNSVSLPLCCTQKAHESKKSDPSLSPGAPANGSPGMAVGRGHWPLRLQWLIQAMHGEGPLVTFDIAHAWEGGQQLLRHAR